MTAGSAPAARRGGLAALGPGATTLLVVDVILVATFLVLLVMHLANASGTPGAAPAPGASASPTAGGTPEPETSPEQSVPAVPDDAQALTEFVLPSGNIWCSMTETSATCTIGQFSFTPPESPSCAATIGPVLTVAAGEPAQVPCVEQVPPRPEGAAVLDYGQASTIGEMTCHSSRNGATCRHNPSGAGFSVARAGYTLL